MEEQKTDQSKQSQMETESQIMNLPKGQPINQIEKFWNEFAKNYSQLADPNVMSFSLTLLNMLQIENADSILEVACGAGNILPIALQRKKPEAKYYATDLSCQMLTFSKYRIEQLVKDPIRSIKSFPDNLELFDKEFVFDQFNLHLQKANSENLEQFNTDFFDIYFSNLCLQITEDAMKMLMESYRVLKQGGKAGFTVWGTQQNCSFFTILPKVLSKNGLQMPAGRSNFYLNKKEDLIKMMELVGFKNVLSWYQFIPFPLVEDNDALKIIEAPSARKIFNELPEESKEKIKSDLITELSIYLKQKKEPIGMEALFIIGTK